MGRIMTDTPEGSQQEMGVFCLSEKLLTLEENHGLEKVEARNDTKDHENKGGAEGSKGEKQNS